MRGLIAAALGGLSKGVGAVSAAQIETNSRKALLQAEEEMRLRLAEAQERMTIAAEDRAIGNIGRTAEAQATADEDILRRRYGEGSEYGGLIQRQMESEETPEARARRIESESDLAWENEERELRRQLAAAETPEQKEVLTQRLAALTGAPASTTRSYSDVVSLGGSYARMADAARQRADNAFTEEERAQASADAERYSAMADSVLQGVADVRLPGATPGGVPTINSEADYDKLPSGTRYRDPQGNIRTKQ
jgi:hypothetical protein